MLSRLKYSFQYLRRRKELRDVRQFCIFSGYPRSGHSIIGALMDAHPEMVISHELDVLEMIIRGYNYRQIYAMILENSRRFASRGRAWSGYNYEVKGQWQGRYSNLSVIGDKRGGRTSLLLSENFSLIDDLKRKIPVPVSVIHVVRNPFDNIITRVRQGNDVGMEVTEEGVREHIRRHFSQAETNMRVINESGCRVLTIRHEDFIEHPASILKEICQFLGLDAPDDWLKACAEIVFVKPHKTRLAFNYSIELTEEIYRLMQRFPFFDGYRYED